MASVERSRSWRTARFWKPIEIAAGCLTLVLWFGAIALWMYFDATRPTVPDQDVGRIYAQNTHGSIVYLNRSEKTTISALMWSAGAVFAVHVAIDLCVAPFRRRNS